jgi:alpha-galactosidase/6-phospho-beta-glucosidase family protein
METDLKIVLIGAASPQWGFTLLRDIIVVLSEDAELVGRRPVLVLEDIDEVNLEKAHRLAELVAARMGNGVRVQSTTDQQAAIADADFVITSLAVGSLEAMQADLEIPYEYGIYQPVGDTVSIGGAIRSARNIPAFLSIAEDIQNHAAPGAWLLNLSNPLSTLARAVTRETEIRAVGLCHELYGGLATLSGWLDFDYSRWRELLEVEVLGINHCAWLQKLTIEGEDAFPKLRAFIEERGIGTHSRRLYDSETPELRHEHLKLILFLRHGVLPYSGDRHCAEFFSEFVNRSTNRGADYGVMLTTIQSRLVDWRGFARQVINQRLSGEAELDLRVSQEACARIIRAMTLDEPFSDVANLPMGAAELPGVPEGAVIERMCSYDGTGPHPFAVVPLPDELQKHLALHAQIVEDVVEASISGNRRLMIEALERDPLLENMDRERIPEMWDRLAAANREWIHPDL